MVYLPEPNGKLSFVVSKKGWFWFASVSYGLCHFSYDRPFLSKDKAISYAAKKGKEERQRGMREEANTFRGTIE